MVQAVIFDVGGVIIQTADWSIRQGWEDRLGLARGGADELVFNSEMGARAQLGEISYDELWTWIGDHLSLSNIELAAFHEGFWAGDVLNMSMAAAILQLRVQYQLAIISNYHNRLREVLKTKYPVSDYFDQIVCSAEEKIMKPDPEIYLRTLQRLGRLPEECIFIDDNLENVTAARQLGMKIIHYTADMDISAALKNHGVAV